MSLSLLFRDELNGFYRSKVMLVLWVGLPALSVVLYLLSPNTGGIPVALFAALLVGSIGGVLSAAMLTVSIINERERHVYDLFLIRPVKRRNLLLAKFFAVYGCVLVAGLLAVFVGVGVDRLVMGRTAPLDLGGLGSSLVLLVSMMAVSCSAGILIGVFSPSILVGVILTLYGGNQLAAIVILPVLLLSADPLFPLVPGFGISALILLLAIIVFNRKQL